MKNHKNIYFILVIIVIFILILVILLNFLAKNPKKPSEQGQFEITENIKNIFINKDKEEVIKVISKDLDYDKKDEAIVITSYSPEPFVRVSYLYVFSQQIGNEFELTDYFSISGNLEDTMIDDINNDGFIEISVFYTSGKLLGNEIYQYKEKKINFIPFRSDGKEVKIWSQEKPEFIDLDGDNVDEIIVTNFLLGEALDETVVLKEFFRWNGGYYEKYNEEKTKEKTQI